MDLDGKSQFPSVSGEQNKKNIWREIQRDRRDYDHSGTTLPFKLKMSIGGRKTMAMSTGNEVAFLWTSSECPTHLIGKSKKVCRSSAIFTALISERWCFSCREELMQRRKHFSQDGDGTHLESHWGRKGKIQKCEVAYSVWSSMSTPNSASLWIWFNTKHVLPWGLSVHSVGLLNGNEGDGQEIRTVWSYWQRKGEGFSLQAHSLLPSIPSPVAPSENSCVAGMEAKAETTTRSTPALMSQLFCPCNPTTLILQTPHEVHWKNQSAWHTLAGEKRPVEKKKYKYKSKYKCMVSLASLFWSPIRNCVHVRSGVFKFLDHDSTTVSSASVKAS